MQRWVSVLTEILKLFFQSHAIMRKALLADQSISIGRKEKQRGGEGEILFDIIIL